ncbi:S-layer homology domain-containing protein [Tumebacillus sp. ITR2]|uniref:S-layer homology domain-containing protein n=1 Tax=Tumebacillus amylolyticus TaxID=2801339 RepID=A0ABS1J9P4_9BACL|nr:S-layer homology domain-containing protein [Tumebacillus amylolyticus]MBL0386994.1 S-layer homology domain-containing protein [Tumebacillus amylolyticus]
MKYMKKGTAMLLAGSILIMPSLTPVSAVADDSSGVNHTTTGNLETIDRMMEKKVRAQLQLSAEQWKLLSSKSAKFGDNQVTVWDLTFAEDGNQLDNRLDVQMDLDGTLYSYDHLQKRIAIGSITEAEAAKRAEAFLQANAPESEGQWAVVHHGYIAGDKGYSFVYEREINGVRVLDDQAILVVDNSGEVKSFSLTQWTTGDFPAVEKAISQEKAQDLYKNALDLRVDYYKPYGNSFQPLYHAIWKSPNTTGDGAPFRQGLLLDAYTGQRLLANGQPAGDLRVPTDTLVPPPASAQAERAVSMTQAEAEQVAHSSGVLPAGSTLKNAENLNDLNFWKLQYTTSNGSDLQITVGSKNGNIRYSYLTPYPKADGPRLSDDQLKQKAIEWLNKLVPNRTESYVLRYEPDAFSQPDAASFRFLRTYQGLPTDDEYLYLQLQPQTGEVVEYVDAYMPVRNESKYPSVQSLITPEQAKQAYAAAYPLHLSYYRPVVGGPIRLVYAQDNFLFSRLDAQTGKILPAIPDLPPRMQGHWAESALQLFSERSLLGDAGDGTDPDKALTRGELVTLLTDFTTSPHSPKDFPYLDVDPYSWLSTRVASALGQGWIASDTEFRPNDTITREEAASILARVLTHAGQNGVTSLTPNYADTADISPWALANVSLLQEKGLMNGDEGLFHPKQNITLAEMCTILVNLTKLTHHI